MNSIIKEVKNELNYQLDNYNQINFDGIKDIILNCQGNIYFMGVGKSSIIAKYFTDTLKCISINSFYLDVLNCLHGDIGTINNKDIVIMISKSGKTKELIKLIPFLKKRNIYLIGLCCDNNSIFENECNLTIKTPFNSEISGNINYIPTNSIMSHILFINILASMLKEAINLDMYRNNHPSGNIGIKVKKIKDELIKEFPKKVLSDNGISLNDILLDMTRYSIGFMTFVDTNDNLLGILSDGDVRRLLVDNQLSIISSENIHGELLNNFTIKFENINKNYYFEEDLEKYIIDCMNITFIPILEKKKIIGIIEREY